MSLERKGDGVKDKTPGFSADGSQEITLHRMPSLGGLNAKELPKKTENQQPEKWTETGGRTIMGCQKKGPTSREAVGGLNVPDLREPRTTRVKGEGQTPDRGGSKSNGHTSEWRGLSAEARPRGLGDKAGARPLTLAQDGTY